MKQQERTLSMIKSPISEKDWHYTKIVQTPTEIPKEYSLEHLLPKVKDQDDTGFCHSYASAALKECQEFNERSVKQTFSPLYLARYIKSIDNIKYTEGTTGNYVMRGLMENGTVPEQDYPSTNYITKSFEFPDIGFSSNIEHFKIKSYAKVNNSYEIKQAISQGKPVLLSIQATPAWYETPTTTDEVPYVPFNPNANIFMIGGHMVLAYGYDEDSIFIFNSWGDDWGCNGKAKLHVNYIDYKSKDIGMTLLMDCYATIDLDNDPIQGTRFDMWIDKTIFIVDNDTEYELDAAPIIDVNSDRAMVPVRFLSEIMGYDVEWNAKYKEVTIIKDHNKIVMRINEYDALINNNPITLDCPPVIKNNRTLVPLRFISEYLGYEVLWHGSKTKQITLLKY